MTDEEKDFAKTAISSYKEYRDIVMYGDLYRLSSPYDSGHYALMYVTKDKKRAVVFGYCIKYQGRTLVPIFKLDGLSQDKKYAVKELNAKNPKFWGSGKIFDGDWLVRHGMNPQLVKLYDSGIWLLEAQE